MPRLFQNASFSTKSLLLTSTVCSDWPTDPSIVIGRHHKHESEMSLPLRLITSFSFQNQKQLIMYLVLPSVQAERGT